MITHMPVLHVVIPMMVAPLCAIMKKGSYAWRFTTTLLMLMVPASIYLLQYVGEEGTIFYSLGGWSPPVGIGYKIDVLSAYMIFLISLIAAATSYFSRFNAKQEICESRQALTYTVMLLCVAGLLGMCISNDLFNIYVFLEISSLATYSLIALGSDRRAYLAAFHYLILGTIGATFYLLGVGFFYAHTGSLNLSDISTLIQDADPTVSIEVGFAFIITGVLLKTAIFPMHMWLVRCYRYAPCFASAFLSATGTKVAVYILLRLLFALTIPTHAIIGEISILAILSWLAMGGIIAGTIMMLFQKDFRKILAFSSVSHIGYLVLSLSLGSQQGLVVTITHMMNHALAKSSLFMAAGILLYMMKDSAVECFKGLYYRAPWTAIGIAIGLASLVGLPFTAGFVSKWILIEVLIEEQQWLMICVVVIASAVAVVVAWRVIEYLFLQKPDSKVKAPEVPISMLTGFWIMILLNLYFGINTDLSYKTAMRAAISIFGGGVL